MLLLNSYHPSYVWTENQTQGILQGLAGEAIPIQDIGIEYLDAKRLPSLSHAEAFSRFLQAKYRLETLECLIVTDNAALDFVLAHRPALFPQTPIVFCGINGYAPELLAGHQRVTGVAEIMDIPGTLTLAMRLHPSARRMVVIHDQTVTGKTLRQEFDTAWAALNAPLETRFLTNLSFAELEKELRGVATDSIALLLSFASDRMQNVIEQSEEARIVSLNCPVPNYALHEQRLGFGIVGGNLLSGRHHGIRTGGLAAKILKGKAPEAIPVVTESTSVPMFDANLLEKWRIPLTSLPPGATVINLPRSIWIDYRGQVLAAIIIFATLTTIIFVLFINIVARRRSEASLRESEARLCETLTRLRQSEEKFRSIFEGAIEGIFQVAFDGRFISANPALATILGYRSPEELVSAIQDSAHQLWLEPGMRDLYLQELSHRGWLLNHECQFKRRDGSLIWVSLNSRLVKANPDDPGFVEGFLEDITRRKQAELEQANLERQLLQSQKMEAVGRLAGGIAHDFNNMLNVILGYSELIMRRGNQGNFQVEIGEIRKAAQRSSDLTRQLLAFSRRQTIAPRVLQLNRHLQQLERLIRQLSGENIEITFELQPDLFHVHLDPTQIDQLVVNLVANARDAMSRGGTLRISTRNQAVTEADCRDHPEYKAGEFVCLTVADTGCGMDRDTLEHIFEPFFTTKPEGKGTGLGMATVYGIIQQNKGFITISSQPDQGTTIRVFLPRTATPADSERTDANPSSAQPGKGSILLVEDQETVRKVTTLMLTELGYQVIPANTPEEAVSVCARPGQTIDLLLTDVVMPQMSGKVLAKRVSELKPGIGIVFMSGHTNGTIANHGVLEPGVFFLPKPFSLNELSELIRKAMELHQAIR